MTDHTDNEPVRILDTGTEREILYQRICTELAAVLPAALRPDLTVEDGAGAIAGVAVAGVLKNLRILSGRQLAVLLSAEANRHEGRVIREPPRYTQDETGDVT